MSNPTLSAPLRLVQITDAHLGDLPGSVLLGLDTDMSLQKVLDLVRQQQPHIDALLVTGDICNGGSINALRRFRNLTRDLSPRTLWLPGNHDDVKPMAEVVGDEGDIGTQLLLGNWLILMLDSTVSGEVGGYLAAPVLDHLRRQLRQHSDKHVLICMHHHPLPVGCDWLDEQLIANADELFAIIDGFDNIAALVWGHVHQVFEHQRRGVQLLSAPSTCVQFAPASPGFCLDRQMPGYRWFDLHADGRLSTGVERVQGPLFDLDYEYRGGY